MHLLDLFQYLTVLELRITECTCKSANIDTVLKICKLNKQPK